VPTVYLGEPLERLPTLIWTREQEVNAAVTHSRHFSYSHIKRLRPLRMLPRTRKLGGNCVVNIIPDDLWSFPLWIRVKISNSMIMHGNAATWAAIH
jgi:hypothetical protein